MFLGDVEVIGTQLADLLECRSVRITSHRVQLTRCLTYMWTQYLFALVPEIAIDFAQVSIPRKRTLPHKAQPLLVNICVSPIMFPQIRRVTSPLAKLLYYHGCQTFPWIAHTRGWIGVPLST